MLRYGLIQSSIRAAAGVGHLKILITGAGGFVGRHLVAHLAASGDGHQVVAIVRRPLADAKVIADLTQFEDWPALLAGVEVVVHLAARVHQRDVNEREAFERDNTTLVETMVEAAMAAGVGRFILLSSIKAAAHADNRALDASDDAYGQSKAAAEQLLFERTHSSPMEVVVIRPPLVYGPGVKANFQRLTVLARLPIPLPLARIDNRRDMVSVFNLVDLIGCCIDHPAAANHLFSVSDGLPYSLSQLVAALRLAQGRAPRLFSLPPPLLRGMLLLLGRKAMIESLFDDLAADCSDCDRLLDWQPRYTLRQTLAAMVESSDVIR
jgi:nucleoside-diphosphate-sugar epimerase